jgi:hypothetical protein
VQDGDSQAPPATTPIEVDAGRKASGSSSGETSNQRPASRRKRANEKPVTPCTSRWLARIVSPGASRAKNAMSLSSQPGRRRAYSTAVS